jgi:hypothetical protein
MGTKDMREVKRGREGRKRGGKEEGGKKRGE